MIYGNFHRLFLVFTSKWLQINEFDQNFSINLNGSKLISLVYNAIFSHLIFFDIRSRVILVDDTSRGISPKTTKNLEVFLHIIAAENADFAPPKTPLKYF